MLPLGLSKYWQALLSFQNAYLYLDVRVRFKERDYIDIFGES
jgi:hypothetical protein